MFRSVSLTMRSSLFTTLSPHVRIASKFARVSSSCNRDDLICTWRKSSHFQRGGCQGSGPFPYPNYQTHFVLQNHDRHAQIFLFEKSRQTRAAKKISKKRQTRPSCPVTNTPERACFQNHGRVFKIPSGGVSVVILKKMCVSVLISKWYITRVILEE